MPKALRKKQMRRKKPNWGRQKRQKAVKGIDWPAVIVDEKGDDDYLVEWLDKETLGPLGQYEWVSQ